MASSQEATSRDLLSLMLRSRKALDHTKTLCTRADALGKDSTELALDVVAVDAKVRWASEMILEQLKLIGSVSKSLAVQRSKLEQDAKAWDAKRKDRIFALDSLLDHLGSQLVPPSFYETSSGSSLFGSQASVKDLGVTATADAAATEIAPETNAREGKESDTRTKWKTLRFFVDERAIEEAVERMDDDRTVLEDLLESTTSQTQSLNDKVQTIKNSLPSNRTSVSTAVQEWLKEQESDLNRMAQLLEDVTHHFDQMESALRDSDAGEVIDDEDMEVLEGDTDELPNIIEETEQSLRKIEEIGHRLHASRDDCEEQLSRQRASLSILESLGTEMTELVEQQQSIEVEAATIHGTLLDHLISLSTLYDTYINYRAAYGKLVQEMNRRRKYRESIVATVNRMNEQLQAMRQEEMSHREHFVASEGGFLPEDLCPYVGDTPAILEITISNDEVPVAIDSQYVAEVHQYIAKGQTKRPL